MSRPLRTRDLLLSKVLSSGAGSGNGTAVWMTPPPLFTAQALPQIDCAHSSEMVVVVCVVVDTVVADPVHAVTVKQVLTVLVEVVVESWSGKTDVTTTNFVVHVGNASSVLHSWGSGFGSGCLICVSHDYH
jgi:hypothetical protein